MDVEPITQAELDSLEAVNTGDEWDNAIDAIKNARGNKYPPDYWQKVKLSGLMDRVFAKFGGDPNPRVVPLKLHE